MLNSFEKIKSAIHSISKEHNVHIVIEPFYSFDILKGIEIIDLCSFEPNKGNGSFVMSSLINMCSKNNLSIIVTPSNENNFRFYSKFGFKESSVYPNSLLKICDFKKTNLNSKQPVF